MSEPFPLLGFPGEDNRPMGGDIVYRCEPKPSMHIVVWHLLGDKAYGLNAYRRPGSTRPSDRFDRNHAYLLANDVFEVQCLIFHMVNTLPPEVTKNG